MKNRCWSRSETKISLRFLNPIQDWGGSGGGGGGTKASLTSFSLQKTFILRRPRVANFADIIKNSAMFTKAIFEDLKKICKI